MSATTQIKRALSSMLTKLFSDDQLNIDIIYKRFESSIWNESQGVNEDVYSDHSVKAIRIEREDRTIGIPYAVSDIQGAEAVYLICDLPEEATTSDLIIDGIGMYNILEIKNLMNQCFVISVKGS